MMRILLLQLRLLLFCASKDELNSLGKGEFLFGLIMTLIAGSFHAWNDQATHWSSKAGLSSLAYLFLLCTYLWVLFAMVGAQKLRFGKLFIYLTLTSPLAFFTAIPFNSFLNPYHSELARIYICLAIIVWRLALLAFYFSRAIGLTFKRICIAMFIPIAIITNFIAWSDLLIGSVSHMSGFHKEFRRLDQPSFSSRNNNNQHKRVTESATSWLTAKGRMLAASNDSFITRNLNVNSEPSYQETILTPKGPVEIYSYWSVCPPGCPQPVPAGFQELTSNDSINQYRHPLAKLLQAPAIIGAIGFIPALLAYLVFMIWRPKSLQEPVEKHTDNI